MVYEFIRYAINEYLRYIIVGVICFWLGIVLATWYIGRGY